MSRNPARSDSRENFASAGKANSQLSVTELAALTAIPPQNEFDTRRSSEENNNEPVESGSLLQRRRKRSRWAQPTTTPTGGTMYNVSTLPTMLSSSLTEEQKEMCALTVQIEDVSKRLRTGDLGIPQNPEDRSPSPEPVYSHEGKRLNTREYRVKKKFEQDRHKAIQRMLILNPLYRPPHDYKPMAVKFNGRVWIPQDENPEVNFVGLIIGPRGNTLKALELDTDCKIIIRGKGSVKEGKLAGLRPLPAEDEPLHAYITANSQEAVDRGVKKIEGILAEAISMPEHQNELRKQQLKQLALLNGTLREDGTIGGGGFGLQNMRCTNCGSTDHRPWNCPESQNITHKIRCGRCGGAGHIERDCKVNESEIDAPAAAAAQLPDSTLSLKASGTSALDDLLAPAPTGASDSEYMSLMAELGSKHATTFAANSSSIAFASESTSSTALSPSLSSTAVVPLSAATPVAVSSTPKFSPGYFSTDRKPVFSHKFLSAYSKTDEGDSVPTEYPPDKPPAASSQPRMVVYPHNAASKPVPSAQAAAILATHNSRSVSYQFPRPPQQLLQVAQQRAAEAGVESLDDVMAKIVTGANKITSGSSSGAAVPGGSSSFKSYQLRYLSPSTDGSSSDVRSTFASNSTRPLFTGRPATTNYKGNPASTADYNVFDTRPNSYFQQQPAVKYASSYWGSGGWNPNANPATAAPPIVPSTAASAYADYAAFYTRQQHHQANYNVPYYNAQSGTVTKTQFSDFDASLFSAPPPPPPPE